MKLEIGRMRPGYIEECWPTIGGGMIHVVIPPENRRPWFDTRPETQVWPDGELSEVATREYRMQSHHRV